MLEIACLARKNTWSHAFVVNQMISLTVVFHHTVVMKYVERYSTVAIITVKINATLEAVVHATKLQRRKRLVLVVNMIFKCSLVILNIEKAAKILFLFAECLVVKSYNVGILALEAAMKESALIARSKLSKPAHVVLKVERYNAGGKIKSLSNANSYAKRKEAVDSIYVMKSAANTGPLLSLRIIHAN
jgi:hypothetical protein